MNEDIIDIRKILKLILNDFRRFLSIFFLITVLGTLSSYLVPIKYASNSILTPSDTYSNQDKSAGSLSSIAGIGSFLGSSSTKENLAIDMIETRNFFKRIYSSNEFLIELYAYNGIGNDGKLVINQDIYNQGEWVRDNFFSKGKPSLEEAYSDFFGKHLSYNFNKEKNLLYVKIEHWSPQIAKKWLDSFIYELNLMMKEREVAKALSSIEFLERKINETTISETRVVLSNMLESNLQKVLLSEISNYYIFEPIEYPRIPEKKSSPQRIPYLIISAFIALLISVLYILRRNR